MQPTSPKSIVKKVDAHQHFWDPAKVDYSWLNPSLGPLYRSFGGTDLEPLIRAAGFDASIVVQAMDSYADTDLMLGEAAAHDWIAGVVGWVPLDRPAEAAVKLKEYTRNRVFKGIRHQINLEKDPDWIIRKEVLEGLRVIADFGLTLDIAAVFPHHLNHIPLLSRKNTDLFIVIDHLAKPSIKEKEWEPWADEIAVAAEYPNVYAKISGLNTAAAAEWSSADLKPYIDHAIKCFGANRIMFGSDWPVSNMSGYYEKVLKETIRALAGYSPTELDAIMGQTAQTFYRISS